MFTTPNVVAVADALLGKLNIHLLHPLQVGHGLGLNGEILDLRADRMLNFPELPRTCAYTPRRYNLMITTWRRRRRRKSVLTVPKRASAAAASLQGRLRANDMRGGGGGKARNTGARERNCSIAITQKQSSAV
jgi:hypothetical protein